jgi:hypothetical protein
MNRSPEDQSELERLRALRDKLRDAEPRVEKEILLRQRGIRGRANTLSCVNEEDKSQ